MIRTIECLHTSPFPFCVGGTINRLVFVPSVCIISDLYFFLPEDIYVCVCCIISKLKLDRNTSGPCGPVMFLQLCVKVYCIDVSRLKVHSQGANGVPVTGGKNPFTCEIFAIE